VGISWSNGALAMWHDVVRSERLVVAGLRMAELGNQKIRKEVFGAQVTAKAFFVAMGVDHTSIDINGKDGALALDLCRPIQRPDLLGAFDVVTNFGCIEHVACQYQAWRNVHILAKTGGLFLHLLPATGAWPGHCDYRYGPEFVPALAACCGYDVLRAYAHEIDRDARFVAGVLRKRSEGFPDEAAFSADVKIDGRVGGR
jgi:SAM-dependent methyltransferase